MLLFDLFTNPYYIILLIAAFMITRYFVNGPRNNSSRNVKDQIIIITGCSAGIGKETAKDLLDKGAKVIFACRDKNKTLKVIDKITNESNRANAIFIELNLTSFKSVAKFINEFSKKFDKLDMLINNAGIVWEKLCFTEDNLEIDMQTNHISHFALTGLLFKFLKKSEDPRVINVSSNAHRLADYDSDYFKFTQETYRFFKMYSITKAANIFFSEALKDLSEKKEFEYTKILSAAPHPGAVYTEIGRTDGKDFKYKIFMWVFRPIAWIFFKNEEMGAQTNLHCAYLSREEFSNGGYYKDCKLGYKEEKIRKNDLEKRIHKLSYNAVMKSEVFNDFKEDKDFKIYMDFFEKRF